MKQRGITPQSFIRGLIMKKELMDILVCPVCKGSLELMVDTEDDGEIVSGTLTCSVCSHTYYIKDRIPDLLPPENVS